jgi:DNA-directed RNA polymerase specialized sigma24 family protein
VSAGTQALDRRQSTEPASDFETTFRFQYARIARVISRVVRDSAHAEELAVEVFLKLWCNPQAHGENVEGWLYRAAVRKGLDELRRRTRRAPLRTTAGFHKAVPTPEEVHAAREVQRRVCLILGSSDANRNSCFCAATALAMTNWHLSSI